MSIVIDYVPACGVLNFKIYHSFLIKPFFCITKKVKDSFKVVLKMLLWTISTAYSLQFYCDFRNVFQDNFFKEHLWATAFTNNNQKDTRVELSSRSQVFPHFTITFEIIIRSNVWMTKLTFVSVAEPPEPGKPRGNFE